MAFMTPPDAALRSCPPTRAGTSKTSRSRSTQRAAQASAARLLAGSCRATVEALEAAKDGKAATALALPSAHDGREANIAGRQACFDAFADVKAAKTSSSASSLIAAPDRAEKTSA